MTMQPPLDTPRGIERPFSVGRIAWHACSMPDEPLGASIHVWAAPLDVSRARLALLQASLSNDERRRAARFHSDQLTNRFVAGRGTLREMLGAYLGMEPCDVRFRYDEHGKPAIAPDVHGAELHFNVAHAAGLALYALTQRHSVGVDVEQVHSFSGMLDVALHFFSEAERQLLSATAPAKLADSFFSVWTRKEAYLKARGTGLLAPLDGFDVSVGRGEAAALRRVAGDDAAPGRWSLKHLEPADGFIGALAIEQPTARLVCRHWCR